MKDRLLLLSLLVGLAPLVSAAEPQPLMTVPGKLLLTEDFAGPALPTAWQTGGRPHSFTLLDGALQGVCTPDDAHGPSIGVPLAAGNVTIRFAMKYTQPGNFLFLLDGESPFGGAAHLLRVGLSPSLIVVQQDRGSLESKAAQKLEKDHATAAGLKAPVPTTEQLADPKFYRTERLAAQPRPIADGQWHEVLVEVRNNDVVVQVDDGPPLTAQGNVLDAKKSRVVFLVGNAGTALIDRVRVWENSPRAAWTKKTPASQTTPK